MNDNVMLWVMSESCYRINYIAFDIVF